MSRGRAGREMAFARDGEAVPGYLALPAAGRGRGVLVVHEGAGLVDQIRDACDRFAREGFVALAPDLYRGRSASESEAAAELIASLDLDGAARDLDAGIGALLAHHAVDGARVGAVGFCMGGQLALLVGTRNRRVGAVVDFYGVLPGVSPDIEALEAPALGIFAEADELVPLEAVRDLQARFRSAGKRGTFRVQPKVRHGFMNDSRPDVFDATAAAEGWDTMLAFLRTELS